MDGEAFSGLEKALHPSVEELTRRRDDSESSWAGVLERPTAAVSVPGAEYDGMTIRDGEGHLVSERHSDRPAAEERRRYDGVIGQHLEPRSG